MSQMKLLDLFCGAGGAGYGYHLAGFDVVGVDIESQPNYPFEFHQSDALEFLELHGHEFDVIHASPPCQDHIKSFTPHIHGTGHLLEDTRRLLSNIDRCWVIENVPGAPMRADFILCGCMFGLELLQRKRWFETSWQGFTLLPPCSHEKHPISVVGNGIPSKSWWYGKIKSAEYKKLAKEAMGIDWMLHKELVQAIPPAYTKYIGGLLLANTALLSNNRSHLTAGNGASKKNLSETKPDSGLMALSPSGR